MYVVEGASRIFVGKTVREGPRRRWALKHEYRGPTEEKPLAFEVVAKEGSWRYRVWPDFDHLIRYPPADWLFAHEGKGMKER